MITKLNEYSLTLDNYDKYYYLALRLDEKTISNLIDGKFEGLKGISESTDIINCFFDIRDILLVMKKEDADNINNLEKVKYDDVEYLTKNNFEILKRLYDAKLFKIGSLLYQGIRKIDYLKHRNSTNPKLNKLYKLVNNKWKKLYDFDVMYVHKLNDIEYVKDYNDLLKRSLEIINKDSTIYTEEELDNILKLIILAFGDVFKHEGEIIIKDNIFNIPKKSVLFIKQQHKDSYKYDNINELINKYTNELKKFYYVKILPYVKGDIISNTHKSVFAYIRYLDKIFK
jgi:hypothetical protein